MIKRTFYIIYNIVYQLLSFWLTLFLGVYCNAQLIPESLIWKDNKPRVDFSGLIGATVIQCLLLISEAGLLILLIYFINNLVLSDTESKDQREAITKKTVKINILASACFIALLLFSVFKH